jgi:3-hydroxyacyl-CoA dehydrogenase
MEAQAQGAVRLERTGAVAVLVMDAPPVNALGARLRAGLMTAIAAAAADGGVQALVLRGAGRGFSAGADIAEFGRAAVPPGLAEVVAALEATGKPVVAALHGPILGGGLELALGAHHRIAAPDASLGFPEVSLGLLPGAGGTQRTPRLIGAARALDLMLTGRRVPAAEALAMGLIDAVVEGDLAAAALALAAELGAEAAAGRKPVPTCDRRDGLADPAAYLAEVAAARQAVAGRLPAPARIVDCVEAAQLLPFAQGMTFERAAFAEMRDSPESAGLRHVFRSERLAARASEGVAARRVDRAAVIGLGADGAALALALAAAGLAVTVRAADRAALAAGLGRIAAEQERQVAAGNLTGADRDAAWARITPAQDAAALAEAEFVVVAPPPGEDRTAAGLALPAGALLASAAAAPDLAALAAGAGRSGAIGFRLTPPRLVELAVGAGSAPEAVATGLALARRMGCLAVRTAAAPGLILPRLQTALFQAADHVLEEGATPAALDAALRAFGLPLGPCEAQDRAGPDRWFPPDPSGSGTGLGSLLRTAGRLGDAASAGYYRAGAPAEAPDDPEVLELLAELRRAKAIVPRRLGAEEMRRRCLTALANEGARLLGEGVAARASDIDAAMVAGGAFPRWEGGPMFWAARRGLIVLRADIRRWGETAPDHWQVAPLIDELIRTGRSLAELDAA